MKENRKYSQGATPDNFLLGTTVVSMSMNEVKRNLPKNCHTVMLCAEFSDFECPDEKDLSGYHIVVHGPLSVNLASDDTRISKNSLTRIQKIIEKLNPIAKHISCIVLHPGSNANHDYSALFENYEKLLEISKIKLALEFMPGAGSQLLSSLDDIEMICKKYRDCENFAICLDTCHMYAAGIDFGDYDKLIRVLKQYIDLNKIACIHLNDSCAGCGFHKDKHANFGTGKINTDTLRKMLRAPEFLKIPKIMEPPTSVYGNLKEDVEKDFEKALCDMKSDC